MHCHRSNSDRFLDAKFGQDAKKPSLSTTVSDFCGNILEEEENSSKIHLNHMLSYDALIKEYQNKILMYCINIEANKVFDLTENYKRLQHPE